MEFMKKLSFAYTKRKKNSYDVLCQRNHQILAFQRQSEKQTFTKNHDRNFQHHCKNLQRT